MSVAVIARRFVLALLAGAVVACAAIEDSDGDGFPPPADCDDSDPERNPAASDAPGDGVDQDCDGEDAQVVDVDGDGHAALAEGGMDCDDAHADVHPGGVEVCGDDIDQDCSGADQVCSELDADGDGSSPMDGDCDDTDVAVSPTESELPYNGRDDDCDPLTPDDDLDGDGFRAVGGGDCQDADASVHPAADEVPYDGVDQDCDGADLVDVDHDGFAGDPGSADCDDTRADIHPGASEIPYDSTDQDCDGRDLVGSAIEVAVADGTQSEPDVAVGGGRYLVVWRDTRTGIDDIYGRFLDPMAVPMGTEFLIRSTPPPPTGVVVTRAPRPAVAFNGTEFLVVWRELLGSTGEIWVQRVGTDGTLNGAPSNVSASTTENDVAPAVAAAGDTWVVAWRISPGRIAARIVGPAGGIGTTATIASSSASGDPAVASDGLTFLVLWNGVESSVRGLQARRLGTDGIVVGGVTTVSSRSGSGRAAVLFDGTRYVALIESLGNIFAQHISPAGALVGLSTSHTDNVLVSGASATQLAPAVAVVAGEYSVVFRDARWPLPTLYGQRVDRAGVVFGTSTDDNELLFAGSATAGPPRIASTGTSGLLVWAMGSDVFASRVEP